MVECQLPKLKVASSSLVARSIFLSKFLTSNFKSHTNARNVPHMLSILGRRKCQPPEMTLARDFESDEGGITESLTNDANQLFTREAVVQRIASSSHHKQPILAAILLDG